MKFRFGFPRLPQAFASLAVFTILIVALVSVDPRVRDKFNEVGGAGSMSSWSDRASDLGATVVTAIRHQSIENAPMVLFATVGGVLFLFMVRT